MPERMKNELMEWTYTTLNRVYERVCSCRECSNCPLFNKKDNECMIIQMLLQTQECLD